MFKMNSTSLTKRFILFLVFFIPLVILSNLESVQSIHNRYFSTIITPLHNLVNPKVHARFIAEKRTDVKNFGVSIYLFDYTKHGKSLKRKKFRDTVGSDVIKFPNLKSLVLIPSLLLITLILISPIGALQKVVRITLGIPALYLVVVFFFAHSFELFYAKGSYDINSDWRLMASLFGFDNQEFISIMAIIIWAGVTGPLILRNINNLHGEI